MGSVKKWTWTKSERNRGELREERKRLWEIRMERTKETIRKMKDKLADSRSTMEFWETFRSFRPRKRRERERIGKEV